MTEDDPAKRLVTINEAAELVNVSPALIRKWIERGLLTLKLVEIDVLKVERDTRRKARMQELIRRSGVS